jgi:hypothetical protein
VYIHAEPQDSFHVQSETEEIDNKFI